MVEIAILIGVYSYLIFALGILGLIYPKILLGVSLFFLFLIARKINIIKIINKDKSLFFILLFLFQAAVNLIGALGPELGFDALWYHLTLPKIYLQNNKVLFIPGNLLYYSAMPKLIEMIYLACLAIQGEILAKLVHFSFGILVAVSLYKLARRYLKPELSLIVGVIFYSTLVVGWQSITAYVDLGRTFFEILALDSFLKWSESQKTKDLTKSAIMLGLAISTKILALGSLLIFCLLIFLKIKDIRIIKNITIFSLIALLIPSPWFVFSFIHTGNPVYPLFSNLLDSSHKITQFSFWSFISDFLNLFLRTADPLSPLILIFLPLFLIYFKKIQKIGKNLTVFCFLTYLVWYFTPRVGGGRFFLPYLPGYCLLCGLALRATEKVKPIKKLALAFIIIITVINVITRFAANRKYLPVIFGKQTRDDFLAKNLNFSYGDFCDTDNFFKKNIEANDLVLVYGVHNLFYLDFPFVHESWAESGMPFTHILVKDGELPERFGKRRLVYYNPQTKVKLFIYGNKLL